jgi:hypothetical protein
MLTWVTKKGLKPSPKAYGFIKVTASKFTNLKDKTMRKSCLQSNNLYKFINIVNN